MSTVKRIFFCHFGISNLTNSEAFSAPFERRDFFSSASLRSASGKRRIFQWGGRAEKQSVFFLSNFVNFQHENRCDNAAIQNIWNYQKLSGTIENVPIASENYPELSKTIRSYQKLSGTIKNVRIASKNYPELSKAIRNYQKRTDSFQKLSGAIKNYPELSRAIRNYQKMHG